MYLKLKKMQEDTGKPIEEFKTERLAIEKNIATLENTIMEFTSHINEKLKNYHSISNKLKKIIESYSLNIDFDTTKVASIYNQSLETFGDLVKKSLDDVKEFKKQLIENRNKFLYGRELELKTESQRILNEISIIESQRKELYKQLEEKKAQKSPF